MNKKDFPKIAFFGTPALAVWVLEVLKEGGILPTLVITNPDAPQGRKLVLTPSPVALWAEAHNIPLLKPATLNDVEIVTALQSSGCELFIVAAYGKIIPEKILNIPKYKTLNVHPSLLPKLRGASPIRSAILEDINPTGISIMILTAGMDEGPILAQEVVHIPDAEWPLRGTALDSLLAHTGGKLLLQTLTPWIAGEITPKEQDHANATYSKKITKEMGLINLKDDHYRNFLKIRAFDSWPGTYFFHEKNGIQIRIKIVDAEYKNGILHITKIIPEGKRETDFHTFMKNLT